MLTAKRIPDNTRKIDCFRESLLSGLFVNQSLLAIRNNQKIREYGQNTSAPPIRYSG